MRTWSPPELFEIGLNSAEIQLYNSATARLEYPPANSNFGLYVCGITPYDATHLGHAFTYLAFDILQRTLIDAGKTVSYVQNITDVDDPLLERAAQMGVNWQQLAAEQINLFRSDMCRLNMLPPTAFVPVTTVIDEIAASVKRLLDTGFAYFLPVASDDQTAGSASAADIYLDLAAVEKAGVWQLGDVAKLLPAEYLALSAERGGDPDRAGKVNRLDPLLWQAPRLGQPSWDTVLGAGRPGWHIGCTVIAQQELGSVFSVQGGGADLSFPHHELCSATAAALTAAPLAHIYMHTGMVAYQGHKMSKSRGNLVFAHRLLAAGYSGSVIRLALLNHHYRSSWEWHDSFLQTAVTRLQNWRDGLAQPGGAKACAASEVIAQLRAAAALDLNTPLMLTIIDGAAASGVDNPEPVLAAINNLLGITVYPTRREESA